MCRVYTPQVTMAWLVHATTEAQVRYSRYPCNEMRDRASGAKAITTAITIALACPHHPSVK